MARHRTLLLVLSVLAGITAAAQVGRVALTLPLVTRDLGLSLSQGTLLVSALTLAGACLGSRAGRAVRRLGPVRGLVLGLGLLAFGGFFGGLVGSSLNTLLALRVTEGVGFLLVVVSAPTMITALTTGPTRQRALAWWGTYTPAGQLLVFGLAGSALLGGWRSTWLLFSSTAAALAVVVAVAARGLSPAPLPRRVTRRDPEVPAGLSSRAWLLAVGFGVFSSAYLTVVALLPTRLDLLDPAGSMSAVVPAVFFSATLAGNLLGGAVTGRTRRPWLVLPPVVLAGLAGSAGAFVTGLDDTPRLFLTVLGGAALGVVPTWILVRAPAAARSPDEIPGVNGLVVQLACAGSLVGPLTASALVQGLGWQAVAWQLAATHALLLGLLVAAGVTALMPPAEETRTGPGPVRVEGSPAALGVMLFVPTRRGGQVSRTWRLAGWTRPKRGAS